MCMEIIIHIPFTYQTSQDKIKNVMSVNELFIGAWFFVCFFKSRYFLTSTGEDA